MPEKDIYSLPAVEIARSVNARELRASDVVAGFLERIRTIDPLVNAYAIIDHEGAMAAAANIDAKIAAGKGPLPLAGVPFHVKDVIPTKGLETAYGSHVMAGNIPNEDPTPVAQLREAGAILIGKSTTPEFASRVLTGSPRYGLTRNPWNLKKSAGGSSGGTGAAIAAGMGPLGLSTDGAGSSRIPASCCGILGMKGSLGLVSNDYFETRFDNYSFASVNSRTTADLAAILSAVNGPGIRDPWTFGRERKTFTCSPDAVDRLRGLRLTYIPRMDNPIVDSRVTELVDITLSKLKSAGAVIKVIPPDFKWRLDLGGTIMASTLYARLAKYVESHGEKMDRALLQAISTGQGIPGDIVKHAPLERTELFDRVNTLFDETDLLVMPTLAAPAPDADHDITKPITINNTIAGSLRDAWYPYTRPFNLTGHPAISIPVGMAVDEELDEKPSGLPVGLQAVGPYFSEQRLLDLAAALETIQPWTDVWPELDPG
jgi:aspartyl-tRNA(Asn)/glutamyl-tRNA(Gln) amidotransferase subunit A